MLKKTVVVSSPFDVQLPNGKSFALKDGCQLTCIIDGPAYGIVEYSIEEIHEIEYYESDVFDESKFKDELKESLAADIQVYMLEDDSKLSYGALEEKYKLKELFEERTVK